MDLKNRLKAALPDREDGEQAVKITFAETVVDEWEVYLEYENGYSTRISLTANGAANALLTWLQTATQAEDYDQPDDPQAALLSDQVPKPPVGKFRLWFCRTLNYYDRPITELAQDTAGNPYIAVVAQKEYDQGNTEMWVVVPLSPRQYHLMQQDSWDLNQLMRNTPWWAAARYPGKLEEPMFAEVQTKLLAETDLCPSGAVYEEPVSEPFFNDWPDTLYPGDVPEEMPRLIPDTPAECPDKT